ncbi:PGF-pre-PGF domain-containing protein [Methanolobus bombayensis]|nr:PGF-pre-PGF domain-containing protein [Methanolobus bombayensis]
MAAGPAYSGLSNANIPEQTVTIIDSDVTVSNPDGTGFGSGYIEFNISGSNSYDDLDIQSSGSPTASGAISVSGSNVYIGTGSSTVQIGTINSTYDGQDGQKLKIDFITESGSVPANNDFESGDLTGWTTDTSVSSVLDTPELRAVMEETLLDGPSIAGDGYDLNNTGDTLTQVASIDSEDANQGTYSLKISNAHANTNGHGYGYIWGPSATSSSFAADAGDKILFDWMATNDGDWYVAYALLIDNQNGGTTVLFADQGSTSSWQTEEVTVAQNSSNLQFQFIVGSYDASGGYAVGATMRIDNIRAMLVTDSVVSSLAQSVTHNYTNDSPSGTVASGRTLTISSEDSDGETSSTTTTLSVYGDAPAFSSGTSFTLSEDETNQTMVFYDAQANNSDGGSDDQDITYSITGGDGQALFDIDSDDGEVRLNGVGVSTLDYETKTSYSLEIEADDGQAVDGTTTHTLTVNVTDVISTLSIGNVNDITCDWGRDFNLNHSILATADPANGVSLNYNVSWIPDGNQGVVNSGDTEWHNQTLSNSTVQEISVLLNGTSTDSSAVSDSDIFTLNITNRNIIITSDPESSYSVDPGTLIWINASAKGEYNETFVGNAVLTLNGNAIGDPKAVTNGNVSFNSTQSAGGTYNFAVMFYNTTYYYNTSTNRSVLTVNVPEESDSSNRVSTGPSLDPATVSSTDTSVKYVMGGTPVKFDLSGGDDPVMAISFDAKDNEGLIVSKVQVFKERPSDVPAPKGSSYSVMSIDVGSSGTISTHNADNIQIRFKVSREWVEENNIDISTIRLTRYHGEQWNDLPTYQEKEENGYIYFYAETPGFSIFEVVGDEVTETTEQVPASTPLVEEKTEPVEEEETSSTPGFTALAGIVFVSLAVLLRRK